MKKKKPTKKNRKLKKITKVNARKELAQQELEKNQLEQEQLALIHNQLKDAASQSENDLTDSESPTKSENIVSEDELREILQQQSVDEYVLPKTAKRWLRSCSFLTSAPKLSLCPEDIGLEVAFAGRSNAGKSSAINTITEQRQLARSSKTPGRTQMINFFDMGNPNKRLIDLPGYGYAAVPENMKKLWQKELGDYLVERKSLNGLVLLMDIRHPLKEYDTEMLRWAKDGGVFVHILLTKADKFKRDPAMKRLAIVRKELEKMELNFSIQLFSALKKEGLNELRSVLANRLEQNFSEATTANELDG